MSKTLSIFKNKEIDFLYTMQMLEHVDDPEKACSEIMRVAKRGFIDTPRDICDIHMGHPEHKWFINLVDNVLVFSKKPFLNINSPIFGVYPLVAFWSDPEVSLLLDFYYRNVSNVQFEWNGEFKYKVIL